MNAVIAPYMPAMVAHPVAMPLAASSGKAIVPFTRSLNASTVVDDAAVITVEDSVLEFVARSGVVIEVVPICEA